MLTLSDRHKGSTKCGKKWGSQRPMTARISVGNLHLSLFVKVSLTSWRWLPFQLVTVLRALCSSRNLCTFRQQFVGWREVGRRGTGGDAMTTFTCLPGYLIWGWSKRYIKCTWFVPSPQGRSEHDETSKCLKLNMNCTYHGKYSERTFRKCTPY